MKILLLMSSLIFTCTAPEFTSFLECQHTRACFISSKTCTPDNCEFGITWKPVLYENIDYIEFEIIGTIYTDKSYILVGFSKDISLGNDGFVSCYSEKNEVKIVAGYYESSDRLDSSIKIITDDNLFVTNNKDRYVKFYNDGTKRLMCRFLRRTVPRQASQQLKDLSLGNEYYLFTAKGNKDEDNFDSPSAGSLIFSDVPIDFSKGSFNVSGTSPIDSYFAKCHGILMVIAWVFCSSVGIILVRYYKEMWPQNKIAKEMVWFQFHRCLQGICVLLTTLAFIFIFIHVRGYSQLDTLPHKLHPILGIIVFILAFLNPIIALCRCRPNTKDRQWFNWIHFFIGSIAYCLSIPTIMIGMRLPGAGLKLSQLDYPQWILIFFVLFQFAVEIILEVHGCLHYRRNKDEKYAYEMKMEEYQAALLSSHELQTKPLPSKQPGRIFKYFMLGLHAIVAALVVLILVIIIAVK